MGTVGRRHLTNCEVKVLLATQAATQAATQEATQAGTQAGRQAPPHRGPVLAERWSRRRVTQCHHHHHPEQE